MARCRSSLCRNASSAARRSVMSWIVPVIATTAPSRRSSSPSPCTHRTAPSLGRTMRYSLSNNTPRPITSCSRYRVMRSRSSGWIRAIQSLIGCSDACVMPKIWSSTRDDRHVATTKSARYEPMCATRCDSRKKYSFSRNAASFACCSVTSRDTVTIAGAPSKSTTTPCTSTITRVPSAQTAPSSTAGVVVPTPRATAACVRCRTNSRCSGAVKSNTEAPISAGNDGVRYNVSAAAFANSTRPSRCTMIGTGDHSRSVR